MKPHAPLNAPLIVAIVFIFLGGVLFFAAMGDGPAPPQSQKTAHRPSGFTPAMLQDNQSEAAQLYIKTCTPCHELPDPQLHTKNEWPEIVHTMVDRLRRRRFFSARSLYVPGEQSVDQISTFLIRYAPGEKETTTSPPPPSP